MRLILVRHAETRANVEGLWNGRTDLSLTPAGEEQAAQLAAHLAPVPINVVYSSPLQRARQTAERIAVPRALAVQLDERLLEQDYGVHEGTADDLAHAAREQGLERFHYTPPQGESLQAVQQRALPFFIELLEKHASQTVLVITHGALIRAVLQGILHLTPADMHRLRHHNTGYSIIDMDSRGHVVHVMNDTRHLSKR